MGFTDGLSSSLSDLNFGKMKKATTEGTKEFAKDNEEVGPLNVVSNELSNAFKKNEQLDYFKESKAEPDFSEERE